jgi:hypothetical protein
MPNDLGTILVMRRLLLAFIALTLSTALFATPLYVIIIQESEKIADSIRAFKNDCGGDKSFADQPCMDRRYKLSGDLGRLVASLNDELNFLTVPVTSTPPPGYEAQAAEDEKRWANRRKDMQLHLRWAHYWMDCLGREDASECKQERGALDKEIYPFGRVGLMSQEPTHVGEEEAKHWHSSYVIVPPDVFIQQFVRSLATNNLDAQLDYYADRVDYYEFRQVPKDVIRKDIERDIKRWPDRIYSMANQPKITPKGENAFVAEFPMAYTLTDSKGSTSIGIL